MDCTVLLSGGLDSAAAVAFYASRAKALRAVHVTYGQAAAARELASATAIASHFQIPLENIAVSSGAHFTPGEIIGRNLFLVASALMFVNVRPMLLATGIHEVGRYYDCSLPFINLVAQLVSDSSGGAIVLATPFLMWSKRMIWEFALANGVPFELTWSCELNVETPCGKCLSCLEVLEASART